MGVFICVCVGGGQRMGALQLELRLQAAWTLLSLCTGLGYLRLQAAWTLLSLCTGTGLSEATGCVDTLVTVHGHWAISSPHACQACFYSLSHLPSFSNNVSYLLKVHRERLGNQKGFIVIQSRKVCGKVRETDKPIRRLEVFYIRSRAGDSSK